MRVFCLFVLLLSLVVAKIRIIPHKVKLHSHDYPLSVRSYDKDEFDTCVIFIINNYKEGFLPPLEGIDHFMDGEYSQLFRFHDEDMYTRVLNTGCDSILSDLEL